MNFLSNLLKSIPGVTQNLLIINIIFYISLNFLFTEYYNLFALHYYTSSLFEPYQIATHFFMHSNFTHLLFNMFSLVMFGSMIERVIGAKRFLILYFLSAIGAFVLHFIATRIQINNISISPNDMDIISTKGAKVLLNMQNYADEKSESIKLLINSPIVGASGAIMGILAIFWFYFPNTELMFIFIPYPIKAKYMIPFLLLIDLTLGVAKFEWDNIAHFAHIGGAIVGLILYYIWKVQRKNFY